MAASQVEEEPSEAPMVIVPVSNELSHATPKQEPQLTPSQIDIPAIVQAADTPIMNASFSMWRNTSKLVHNLSINSPKALESFNLRSSRSRLASNVHVLT